MKKNIQHSKSLPYLNFYILLYTIFTIIFINASTSQQASTSGTTHVPDVEAKPVRHRRQLLSLNGAADSTLNIDPSLVFENSRLVNAYIALQAWKQAIISDPNNVTANWIGSDVCNYTGVFCANALDCPSQRTVAGIDINGANIAGFLPNELGLLYDMALFHINSNRFCGILPWSFLNLKLLFEMDVSNNRFAGKFPCIVLRLPSIKYLDIRFNEFEGKLPNQLFDKHLDALFINNNRFSSDLPENIGNSPVSVMVLANNMFQGCLPGSFGNMSRTLNEIILKNNEFHSCLPNQIGMLKNLTVFDVSFNQIMGSLPESIEEMVSLEHFDVSHNMLSGGVTERVCALSELDQFSYAYNFITNESSQCLNLLGFDDRRNCLRGRPTQRSMLQCKMFLQSRKELNCTSFKCASLVPSPPPPPPHTFTTPPVSSPPPPPLSPPPVNCIKNPPSPPPPPRPEPSPPPQPMYPPPAPYLAPPPPLTLCEEPPPATPQLHSSYTTSPPP